MGDSGFDSGCHFRRIGFDGRFEAGDGVSVAIEEEFGEIPLDFAAEFGVFGFAGEELVERRLVVAFDRELGHHGKADIVFLGAEGLDFLVGAGLLAHEVVGGNADDDQPLILIFLIKSFESGVLRGVSAMAGDVDQEQDFAVVFGERGGLPVDGLQREVVDAFRRSSKRGNRQGSGDANAQNCRENRIAHVSSSTSRVVQREQGE